VGWDAVASSAYLLTSFLHVIVLHSRTYALSWFGRSCGKELLCFVMWQNYSAITETGEKVKRAI